MAEPRYVSLTAPAGGYESQLADIKRRQKMAELLAQQGGEDIKVESVNGVPTPISPFQGLAKALKSGMGGYLAGKAAEEEAALEESENKAIADVFEGMKDTPDVVKPGVLIPDSETEGGPGAYTLSTTTPGQKLSSSEKTNRLMAALIAHPKIAAVAPMYMQGMRNDIEDTRYDTSQKRLDTAEATDASRRVEDVDYRNRQAKTAERIAIEAAADRRQAHADAIALRNLTAAGPSKAYTVTGADGKTTNFFGTNAEARALSLTGNRVVEGGVVPKVVPTRAADDLMNKAAAYDKAESLNNDFKPEYTNLGVVGVGGDAVLALKKKYGDNDPAVQWWTSYNEKVGQIRNKLYGASLTPNEIAEWLKIAVNPNMNGTTIQANLERQRQLEENAMFRSVGFLKGSGYSEESISGATAYPSSKFKFNKPQAVLPDKPVDNSEAGKRARLAAAKAKIAAAAAGGN